MKHLHTLLALLWLGAFLSGQVRAGSADFLYTGVCSGPPAGASDPWRPVYEIKFPGDVTLTECSDPIPGTIEFDNFGCGFLAINFDTVRFETPGGRCSKLQITYRVLNWCEYSGGAVLTPTIIPRDIDQDDDLDECTWMDAVYDPWFVKTYLYNAYTKKDFTADGSGWKTGTNYGIVRLFSGDDEGERKLLPDKVLVRYRCPYGSGYRKGDNVGYLIYRRNARGKYEEYCYRPVADLCANSYSEPCWSPGYYSYTRMVKYKNTGSPRITLETEDLDFCAYGNGQANCDGLVMLEFSAAGGCLEEAPATLRPVRFQLNGEGPPVDETGTRYNVLRLEGNRWRVWGRFPEGAHRFLVQVRDDCGNLTATGIDFSVRDCQAPALVCIQRLRLPLMPVDTDRDGRVDGGAQTVPARAFIVRDVDDCNRSAPAPQNVLYFAIKASELPDGPESITLDHLTEARSSVRFTCADLPEVDVYVVALDGAGNFSYCPVTAQLRAREGLCPPPAPLRRDGGPAQAVTPAGRFELYQNAPNPVAGQTVIAFHLPEASTATLDIRDLSGRLVRRLQGAFTAGYQEFRLSGEQLPDGGMYFYTLRAGEMIATRRMVVLDR